MRSYVETMSVRLLAAVGLSLALAACVAQPTPYRPRSDGFGYKEQQLDSRTWRVEFIGNTVTPRETVENYLLYRAAEIMLFGGYDTFVLLDKDIERNVDYRGYGGYGPRFGVGVFERRHYGYGFEGDYGPDGYYALVSYAGYATVRTYERGEVPSGAVVYNAREVVQQLGPAIRLPQPGGG